MESTKEAGNQAFKANNFEGAVRSWSEALAVDKTNKSFNSKLHCNLAAAYAKVGGGGGGDFAALVWFRCFVLSF